MTDRYAEALSLWQEQADRAGVALSELYLGLVCVEAGRFEEARGLLRRALRFYREVGWLQHTAECLEGIAAVAHARGEAVDAVVFLGVAAAFRERTGYVAVGALARLRERELAFTGAELGDQVFGAAWVQGRALAQEDALDRADRAIAG